MLRDADLQKSGIAGLLARVGLDKWARDLAPIEFELVAIATRSEASAARACDNYESWTARRPKAYHGETPWRDVIADFPDLDVMSVATPMDEKSNRGNSVRAQSKAVL